MFKKFWGVKGDIEAFSEFIRLYITRNDRWTSPLFLFGESYGTTRSAGIAGYLADRGISFNGITLLSTVLNFETLEDNFTNDQPYIFLIPTFTMIAGYHHRLAPGSGAGFESRAEGIGAVGIDGVLTGAGQRRFAHAIGTAEASISWRASPG